MSCPSYMIDFPGPQTLRRLPSHVETNGIGLCITSVLPIGLIPGTASSTTKVLSTACLGAMNPHCEICGSVHGLDSHHVKPRRMGGTKDPAVHDESNLMTLCRGCHRNIHDGRWNPVRSPEGISVVDPHSGEQIMRRLQNPGLHVPS